MDEEKEVYWLWYEYLRRSTIYKRYCEYAGGNEIFDRLKKIDWATDKNLDGHVQYVAKHIIEGKDLPFWCEDDTTTGWKRFCADTRKVDALRLYYVVFGDIFNENFSDRWDNNISHYVARVKDSLRNSDAESVNLYDKDFFEREAKDYTRYFSWDNYAGWDDNLFNYIKHLSEYIIKPGDLALFKVDLTKGKTVLMECFGKLLDEMLSSYRDKDNYYKNNVVPFGALYVNKLKRYLRVYDLKQGGNDSQDKISNREIFREIYPDLTQLNAHEMGVGRARASKEFKYAERIINNVEHGLFPGLYAKIKGGCDPDLK